MRFNGKGLCIKEVDRISMLTMLLQYLSLTKSLIAGYCKKGAEALLLAYKRFYRLEE